MKDSHLSNERDIFRSHISSYFLLVIPDRLQYARQLLKNAEYKNAVEEFKLVLDSLPKDELAKNGLISAQKAPTWKQEGSRYTVKKMDIFNSRRADYSPMLLGDQFEYLYLPIQVR